MNLLHSGPMGQAIFVILWVAIGGLVLLSVLRGIDQIGRPKFKKKGLLVKKLTRWSNRFDMNLRPINTHYGKVSVDGAHFTVRIFEGDFDNMHNGQWCEVVLITGWSGKVYAITARP